MQDLKTATETAAILGIKYQAFRSLYRRGIVPIAETGPNGEKLFDPGVCSESIRVHNSEKRKRVLENRAKHKIAKRQWYYDHKAKKDESQTATTI